MTIAPAVTFNYGKWVQTYPIFARVNQPQAQIYFNIATNFCENRLRIICDPVELLDLLNMLTAHLAWLLSMRDGFGNPSSNGTVQPPMMVGRISDATEGSVSVSTEFASQIPIEAAWFMQTQFGAMFWQATAPARTVRYVPGPSVRRLGCRNGPFGGRFGGWIYPNGS